MLRLLGDCSLAGIKIICRKRKTSRPDWDERCSMLFSRGTTQVPHRSLGAGGALWRANGRSPVPPTWFQRRNSGATFRGAVGAGTFTLSPARCCLSSRVLLPVAVFASQFVQSIPEQADAVNIQQSRRTHSRSRAGACHIVPEGCYAVFCCSLLRISCGRLPSRTVSSVITHWTTSG